jgi:hypothetical protein
MEEDMKKRTKIVVILVSLFLFGFTAAHAAPVLSIAQTGSSVTNDNFSIVSSVGSSLSFDIWFNLPASEFPNSAGLYGATFYVDFNPAIVSVTSASFNTSIFSAAEGSKVTINSSNISYGLLDNFDSVGEFGTFKLGSFTISLDNPFSLTSILTRQFSAGDNGDFVLWEGTSLDSLITFKGGEISAVPIPAAVWLLGSGVVGLVALKRRKKA